MLDFGVLLQIYHRRYNFGNTGFIIGTKQGLAVGHNQIFPLMVEQFGELGRRKNHILFGAKNNVLTVIILHDTRRNILATHIGACIHVGNKADDGQRLVCIGRKSGEQITISSNVISSRPKVSNSSFRYRANTIAPEYSE